MYTCTSTDSQILCALQARRRDETLFLDGTIKRDHRYNTADESFDWHYDHGFKSLC